MEIEGFIMTEKTSYTSYNKLIRDKIPEIIRSSNRVPECEILDEDEEYPQYLIRKLYEEVLEFMEEPCVEELADIKEVVDALSRVTGFERVEQIQKEKREERGGFEKRILLTGVYEEEGE